MRVRFVCKAVLAVALILALGPAHVLSAHIGESTSAIPSQKPAGGSDDAPFSLSQASGYDPVLGDMISQISESEMYRTTYDLQNISTRQYLTPGNGQAATYIYNRLSAIPGLHVEYSTGQYHNVIASLRGKDTVSGRIIIVGAHYDSASIDPTAPGATDNGCGAATVLELARVMSRYQYDDTITFAFWNAEENGLLGSYWFARNASLNGLNIPLAMNYDSGYYDPGNEYILDINYDASSASFASLLAQYNSVYTIGFNLTFNRADWSFSDHRSFWQNGYPAILTHSETEPPQAHSQNDTIELVSFEYARKNAQLGILLLAEAADISALAPVPGGNAPTDTNGDGKYDDVNGNGRKDFADVVLYFNQMSWIAANEPVALFDYNANGRIDFADVVWLFSHL
jgi:hypothetical protein